LNILVNSWSSIIFNTFLGNVATINVPEYIDLETAFQNKKRSLFGFNDSIDSIDSSNGEDDDGIVN
jgi:hypothetical protein